MYTGAANHPEASPITSECVLIDAGGWFQSLQVAPPLTEGSRAATAVKSTANDVQSTGSSLDPDRISAVMAYTAVSLLRGWRQK